VPPPVRRLRRIYGREAGSALNFMGERRRLILVHGVGIDPPAGAYGVGSRSCSPVHQRSLNLKDMDSRAPQLLLVLKIVNHRMKYTALSTMAVKPRRRSAKNKNLEAGIKNRTHGLGKKAHTFHQFYGGDVLLLIRHQDGTIAGYQSRRGLIDQLASTDPLGAELFGPDDYDTLTERRARSGESVSSSDGIPSSTASPATESPVPVSSDRLTTPSAGTASPAPRGPADVLQPKPISARQRQEISSLIEQYF